MMKKEEFETLQKENDEIRNKINKLIGVNYPNYSPLWVLISELIDNEIEQEKACGQ